MMVRLDPRLHGAVMQTREYFELRRPTVCLGSILLTTAIVAVFLNGLSLAQIAVVLVAILSALLLLNLNRFHENVAPLEILVQEEKRVSKFICNMGALALAAAPVMAAFAPSLGLAYCALVTGLFSAPIARLVRRAFERHQRAREVSETLAREKFRVAFYVAGVDNVGYQINQWLPVAERLEFKCCIILRRRAILQEMQPTTLPLIFAKTPEDLSVVLQRHIRVLLYPGNAQENAVAFRHFRLQHFFINHGESDKAVNQSKFLMAYDRLLVAGPLAERRLREAGLPLRDGQVAHVGRPQTELALEQRSGNGPLRRVLYAPTWEGFVENVNYSSVVPMGLGILKTLAAEGGFEVVVKPHPLTGHRLATATYALHEMMAFCSATPGFKFAGTMEPVHPHMNWCDLMVADTGSVVNDFLATRKPMILCNARGHDPAQLATEFPTSKATYPMREVSELIGLLRLAESQDPIAAERDHIRRESLGDFPEGSLARFQSVIRAAF